MKLPWRKPHDFCKHCGRPMASLDLTYSYYFDRVTGKPEILRACGLVCQEIAENLLAERPQSLGTHDGAGMWDYYVGWAI